jgi:hypothetical protein
MIAERIRMAYDRAAKGEREWIAGTLELAEALAEARERFTDNGHFSHWLIDKDLDALGSNDRAALIGMGKNRDLASAIIQETNSRSWQLIWRNEVQPRLTSASKIQVEMQNHEKPASVAETEAKAPVETVPSAASIKPVSKRSPFHGWERADEVAATYLAIKARCDLGKIINARGGKEIWSLILAAIDAGFLTATDICFSKATLRILFPSANRAYCGRFNLAVPRDRANVRDIILPAAIANREAVLVEPEQLEAIVNAHQQRLIGADQAARKQQRVADALAAMPDNEQEIIMFGERIWPNLDSSSSYDYDQVRAAVWYFHDLNGWLEQSPIAKNRPEPLAPG